MRYCFVVKQISYSPFVNRLSARREALGISYAALAKRSGVSEPTLKRILGGRTDDASFSSIAAIAQALGMPLTSVETSVDDLRAQQARTKAERVARMVQGTSALEGQAVGGDAYQRLVQQSFHELMAGSNRRLWSA